MRSTLLVSLLAPQLALSAINLDGQQASTPALVGDDTDAPVSDPSQFDATMHDCPATCRDYSNMHSWTPYHQYSRLERCDDPMMLQLAADQAVDSPGGVLIRACTVSLTSRAAKAALAKDSTPQVDNPKKSSDYYHGAPIHRAAACSNAGEKKPKDLVISTVSGAHALDSKTIQGLFKHVRKYFEAKDNCNENSLYVHQASIHHNITIGIHVGAGLGKASVKSALDTLGTKLDAMDSSRVKQLSAEHCDTKTNGKHSFGVVVDMTADLKSVQSVLQGWDKGKCVKDSSSTATVVDTLHDVSLMVIGGGGNSTTNNTKGTNSTLSTKSPLMGRLNNMLGNGLAKRGTCEHRQVQSGDICGSLAEKCGVSGYDFEQYNKYKDNFCSTLKPGQWVCCSEGDPYVPPKPKPDENGYCASHFIEKFDTCDGLAQENGLSIDEIESFHKGKTWAWNGCSKMLWGYNMCLSEGTPPLPPPQEGTQCGPLVPGTERPTDPDTSLADLNPCPLKACCSNWGFCGVFSSHCDKHEVDGGGPGSKDPDYPGSCVSNCGFEIKQNSGPPESFGRIGYYEAFGMERECLRLYAKDANVNNDYTILHWAFGNIDTATWSPVVDRQLDEWEDFKALRGVKRILSLGGWAFSTEPATYNIIRQAIIDHRDEFAQNCAKFIKDQGIDGIDIDWEYPGAPDIYVDGHPIGQKGDGIAYFKFLTVLKRQLGSDHTVSIAAPASYWYLRAFPIDKIAKVIDYIVYMTYDLHGQWDYGNVNAFDSCDSGKCIRSHVNLTETRNTLSMLTKAGVPNNKIYVGEASYGRTFHMAQDGCWGPDCQFTGSRTESDAAPGRCTKTGGYLGMAEINEIILTGDPGIKSFHDGDSNTDVVLYDGDYIAYMTGVTKETRRKDWKDLNFAGSIDWAVDLQSFSNADFATEDQVDKPGSKGCIAGYGLYEDTDALCQISCAYGYCPESSCICSELGTVPEYPPPTSFEFQSVDPFDIEGNKLCAFACQRTACPPSLCEIVDENPHGDPHKLNGLCPVFWNGKYTSEAQRTCNKYCEQELKESGDEDDYISNAGCSGFTPLGEDIKWEKAPLAGLPSDARYSLGHCFCNNPLIDEVVPQVIEALELAGSIGCLIMMSALKLVVKVGLAIFPEIGRPLEAGLDAITSAAQIIHDVYPEGEDPQGAWDFWLAPCGNLNLIPDDLRKAFDTLNTVSDHISGRGSIKTPKGKSGTGKKGDRNNPRSFQRPPKRPTNGKPPPNKNHGKCKGKTDKYFQRRVNTFDHVYCDKKDGKQTTDRWVATSVTYSKAKREKLVSGTCRESWSQACYHYSSVIRNNPKWSTLKCKAGGGTAGLGTKKLTRDGGPATDVWLAEHIEESWIGKPQQGLRAKCDKDEYPGAYFFNKNDKDYKDGGKRGDAQLVRFLPGSENKGAGQMWNQACMRPLDDMDNGNIINQMTRGRSSVAHVTNRKNGKVMTLTGGGVSANVWPAFTIDKWNHKPHTNDGLELNPCWPSAKAGGDPGFALLDVDPYNANNHNRPGYDYKKPYVKGQNGS